MPHTLNDEMRRCIEECQSCQSICLEAVAHCLLKGSKHADVGHITALLDCEESCGACANFMLRGSAHHTRVCEVCAEVCEACAASCDELSDDDLMRRCAEECRRCAESCRKMARTAARA